MANCKLNPCPCGKTPAGVCIDSVLGQRWVNVSGDCCAGWWIEFDSGYAVGDELIAKAEKAWNEAPRGQAAANRPPERAVVLQVKVGGDTWQDAAEALTAIAERIEQRGQITHLVGGGGASGYTVIGHENEGQTPERYRRQNAEYVAQRIHGPGGRK